MNYQTLTTSEKALLKPLLARKLGTSPGKIFTAKVNGKVHNFRCTKLQFSWARESIDVTFVYADTTDNCQYIMPASFMQTIAQEFNTLIGNLPSTETHHHRVADRVLGKDKPHPRNVNEIISLLKDTDAYEILREDKLSRRDIDVTTRTIANIIGMLEIMQRED